MAAGKSTAVGRPKLKVKKGDTVTVLAGRDRGAKGEILKVFPEEQRVIVQGVNIVKRHTKPSRMGTGGIEEKEAPIHISNVSPVADGKPTRVRFPVAADGSKSRVAVRTDRGNASAMVTVRTREWYARGIGLVRLEREERADSTFLRNGRQIWVLVAHGD